MSRRYDTRTTTFSPEGRLFQVEYAMEAISHAGTCLGIVANDGIVLVAERKNTHKLLDEYAQTEKIYKLTEHLACAVAGVTADANVLVNEVRLIAQRYFLQYQAEMPVEQLVAQLCDIKQAYTQFGGKRPFGVGFHLIGWDSHFNYQLYASDPSGNYAGWKAHCVGSGSGAAMNMLKQDYKEGEMTVDSSLDLAIRVICKTLDIAKLTADRLEIATLTRNTDGRMRFRMITADEISVRIKKYEDAEAKAKAEAEKQKQAAATEKK